MTRTETKNKLLPMLPLLIAVIGICLFLSGCNPQDYDVPLEELEKEYVNNCWSCTIFKTVFAALDSLVVVFYHEIAGGALALLAMIFAIWILFHVGRLFLNFKMPDINQFWTDSLKTSFAVLCCGVLLMGADTIFIFLSYTIVPVFQGFIDVSLAVINSGFGSYGSNYSSCNNSFDSMSIDTAHAFQQGISDALSCFIAKMHARMVYGSFYAQKMIASGDFIAIVFGIGLFIIFGVLNFIFPFYLVDGIFKLGIAFILLPLFIAFWPFKILRQYTLVGWNIFLSTFMQILMIAIFLTLAIEILVQFTMKLEIFDPEKMLLNQPGTVSAAITRTYTDPFGRETICAKVRDPIMEREQCILSKGTMDFINCDENGVCDIKYATIMDSNPRFVEQNLNFPMGILLMIFLGMYLIKLIGTMNRMAAQFAGAKANSGIFNKAIARLMTAGMLIAQAGVGLAMLAKNKLGAGKNAAKPSDDGG